MKTTYKTTMYACFIGYIVQAIVNNFAPLLFVTFQSSYGIPLSEITMLITINFLIQLGVDLASTWFIRRVGTRAATITAHVFSAAGLILMAVLPELFPSAFAGLLTAVLFYAIGGGLIEVLISPIMEACPTKNKEQTMSLLHSFYCWGHVGVVLLSTAFFFLFGIQNWKLLALIWAVVPAANILLFAKAPIYTLEGDEGKGLGFRELFSNKLFWILMVMMVCSGASEQAVSQWASTFAEQGLGVSKMIGDLAGPMSFAVMMGMSRLIYGRYGDRLPLKGFMKFSSLLCIASYLCISLIPVPIFGLIGCAVCGFSVGILWPGTFSEGAASIRGGGTAMFALLALGGDFGCSAGPTLAGFVSSLFGNSLHIGILVAIIFPVLMLTGILLLERVRPSRVSSKAE